jgi:putative ABC transport system permease protein
MSEDMHKEQRRGGPPSAAGASGGGGGGKDSRHAPSPGVPPAQGGRFRSSFQNGLWQALDVVRSHKMRSGLVILGVAIGVATLMGMVGILAGLGEKIKQDIASSDQVVLTLSKFDYLVGGVDEKVMSRPDFTPEDAIAIEDDCPAIDRVDFYIDASRFTILHYRGEKTRLVSVAASGVNFPYVYSIPIEEGRYFTPDEVNHARNVVVLGYGPREDLFPNVDPIGKQVRLGRKQYTVVGTFSKRQSIFGSLGENYALIPHTTYMQDWAHDYEFKYINMTVREGATVDEAVDQVTELMRIRRKIKPSDEQNFVIMTSDAVQDFVSRITGPIALALVVISSIGLMVGGIGVMNIMLVSVTERTSEVGLRKAMGATKGDVQLQFLMEAGTLTGIGGIIGVAAGYALAGVVSKLIHIPMVLSPIYVIVAVIFSVGIGVFFGLHPATRAAKMDPVTALRWE